MKFQKGDTVRVVANAGRLEELGINNQLFHGIRGEIMDVEPKIYEGRLKYCARFPKLNNCWWFAEQDFELVESKFETASEVKSGIMQEFNGGATRHSDVNKLDYEAGLNPLVLQRYLQYLGKHTIQADGKKRDFDNWQLGMPKEKWMKSKIRHGVMTWLLHRGYPAFDEAGKPIDLEESLCAELFNCQGYLLELLKEKTNVAG